MWGHTTAIGVWLGGLVVDVDWDGLLGEVLVANGGRDSVEGGGGERYGRRVGEGKREAVLMRKRKAAGRRRSKAARNAELSGKCKRR